MIRKIRAAFALLQAGRRVNSPERWKKGQITVDAVHAFLWAGVTAWAVFTGHELPVTGEAIDGISTYLVTAVPAVIGLWDVISTIITSNKVGVPSKTRADAGSDTQ
ncbi:MAG: hypothetical protein WC997_02365 [Porticoccaceae bacterium]